MTIPRHLLPSEISIHAVTCWSMTISLYAVGCSNAIHRFDCREFPVVIGRADDAAIVLDDRWVSRRHCQVEHREDRYILRDLGSKHGTFVNGTKVSEVVLALGDQIDVGLSSFVVKPINSASDSVSASDSAKIALSSHK